MSDTPRTDVVYEEMGSTPTDAWDDFETMLEHARTLERELAQAKAETPRRWSDIDVARMKMAYEEQIAACQAEVERLRGDRQDGEVEEVAKLLDVEVDRLTALFNTADQGEHGGLWMARDILQRAARLLRATQSATNTDAEKANGSAPQAPGPESGLPGPTFESPAQSAPAQEPIGRVERYTGDLHDMSVIIWLGEQPPEGTLLYAAPQPAPAQEPVSDALRAFASKNPLAASQPDEARELLRQIEPYLDAIICYASTTDEYKPNAIAARIRAYLEKHK